MSAVYTGFVHHPLDIAKWSILKFFKTNHFHEN